MYGLCRTNQIRALARLTPLLVVGLWGCDGGFFAEPASQSTTVVIELTEGSSAPAASPAPGTSPSLGTSPAPGAAPRSAFATTAARGSIRAFDAVDRAHIRVELEGGGGIDEVIEAERVGGDLHLTVELDLESATVPGMIQLELRTGSSALFEGSSQVALERGTRNTVELAMSPVPAAVELPAPPPPLEAIGDSLPLGGAVVFATGDTVPGPSPEWRSLDPGVVEVVGTGLAVATGEGEVRLEASHGSLSSQWLVRVEPVVVAINVRPGQLTVAPGEEGALEAERLDRRGNRLHLPPVEWSSEDPSVVTVDDEGTVTGVTPGTTRVFARSGDAEGWAAVEVSIIPPEVETLEPTEIDEDAATFEARVTPGGASGQVVFRYGRSPDLAESSTTGPVSFDAADGTTVVSTRVTGLEPSTAYYVRAEATNPAGTGSGETVSFTTVEAAVETVTLSPSVVQIAPGVTATLEVELRDRRGTLLAPRPVEWQSEDPTIATVDDTGRVEGVQDGTTRVIAQAEGVEGAATIEVALLAPLAETLEPSRLLERQVRLDARVTPRTAPTQVVFRWGLDSSLQNASVTAPISLDPSSSSSLVRQSILSLTPNTTYYYRVEATNAAGTTVGEIRSFRTLQELPAPTITNVFDDGGVFVYWDYPSELIGQVYFELERGIVEFNAPPTSWNQIATLEVTYYNDEDAEPGYTYGYRVRACGDGVSCSPYSNIDSTYVWHYDQAPDEPSMAELHPATALDLFGGTPGESNPIPEPQPACRAGASTLFCQRVEFLPPN
ncbi:MAG: hypothetical protein EA351_01800 [Gemmatimonadales bacterium]|nr:MAG: hypothetical protein EA351_01800 [Gemmatimonadales bacterium]